MPLPTQAELSKWIRDQIRRLMQDGFPLNQAEETVRWVIQNCPPDEDPREWVPRYSMVPHELDEVAVAAAAEAWRNDPDIPLKWRRLLDAVELPEDVEQPGAEG